MLVTKNPSQGRVLPSTCALQRPAPPYETGCRIPGRSRRSTHRHQRNGRTVDVLRRRLDVERQLAPHRTFRDLRASFRTVHSAKGLVAGYVVDV
ncbi:hypothetical protein [Nocardioides deserti]|uniref:Uncharacterized protein n=1 Tax=Nocardioides deserti TaxID=1588644 RepID=A0ABR6U4L5_9ACTN|nr:hypothetical protein [Nocardioides deserti]MBC2959377.1 hypothetical protein [Nocardioides deserti]GGO73324.1 hypothetical protein GCM10012276_18630 [Nocardioides deserti]